MHQEELRVYRYCWANLIVYSAAITFMAGVDSLSMAVLLGSFASRWSICFGAASLLMSAFGLCRLLLPIPSGWISTKTGYKLPAIIGACLIALGFCLRSTTDDYTIFLLYNTIAASGWGIIFGPIGRLVITWFPGREIGLVNSMWPTGFLATQAIGSLTGIPFMAAFGWQGTWCIYGLAAILIAGSAFILFESQPILPPEPRLSVKPVSILQSIRRTMNTTNIICQYTVFASVGFIAAVPALLPPMLMTKGG